MLSFVLNVAVLLAILLPLLWFAIRYLEWKHLFRPQRGLEATPKDAGLAFEDVEFISEDGLLLHGWWIPCEGAAGTLLFCHGNAGNLGSRVETLAALSRLGLHLFAFDYRGYGKSKGLPTEVGTYRDARAAYEVVRSRYQDADFPPVIVYGRSLGGAVAARLAADKPLAGLVIEGSFSSAADMADHLYPNLALKHLLKDRYCATRYVAGLELPKLFAHSTEDEVVPFEVGRRLFDAASEPKQFVRLRGSHDQPGWTSSSGYWDTLQRFVQTSLFAGESAPLQ